MTKTVLLAAAATMILAGATMTAPAPSQAGTMAGMSCKDAAKAQYPDDRKMRHEYKKSCKEAWKMHGGKTGMMSKFKLRKDS
jgi:hypothetical protein